MQTQVSFLCRHDNPVSGDAPYADRTTLQATRVGGSRIASRRGRGD